jgi:hypothetical protein
VLHQAVFLLDDWFWHPLRGLGYQWWSGIGSDIGEITLIGGLVTLLVHHNCEQKGCWRLGHVHPEHGRPVCRAHYHHDLAPKPKEG